MPGVEPVLKRDDRIYLCLSGGGLRATYFHLGVLRSLRKHGLLKSVAAICSVSGGSITAAHVVANWTDFSGTDDTAFEAACRKLMTLGLRDLRGRIIRRWLLSLRWFGYGRVRSLSREYRTFFGKRKIADLYNRGSKGDQPPELHILSTSFTTGHICSFSGAGFSTLFDDGIRDVPASLIDLEIAIAASSAFPPLFPPLRLTREDVGGDHGNFPVAAVYLTDGGVYDNLGIERCLRLMEEAEAADVLLLSDAGASFNWEEDSGFAGLISRTVRSTDIMMRNAAAETLSVLSEREGLRFVHVPIFETSDASVIPVMVQRLLKNMRTDLDRFNEAEMALLITHGEAVADKVTERKGTIPLGSPKGLQGLSGDDMMDIAKAARRRRLGLFNPRDVASYILAALPTLALVAFVYFFTSAWLIKSENVALAETTTKLEDENRVLADTTDVLKAANADIAASREVQAATTDVLKEQLAKISPPPAPAQTGPGDTTVFIQFAGFNREAVIALATQLDRDWKIPAPDKGGERLKAAAGLNEVRFGPKIDEPLANRLADAVLANGIVSKRPKVRSFPKITKGNLEIWISQ